MSDHLSLTIFSPTSTIKMDAFEETFTRIARIADVKHRPDVMAVP
jgi:hypothetical protein